MKYTTSSSSLLKLDYSTKSDNESTYYSSIMRGICKDGSEKKTITNKRKRRVMSEDRNSADTAQQKDIQQFSDNEDHEERFTKRTSARQLLKCSAESVGTIQPTANDVLCGGRGATIRQHNTVYTQLIEANKPLYKSCQPRVKPLVAKSIVAALSLRGGRFLKLTDQGEWIDIGADAAVSKTVLRLRRKHLNFRRSN